MSDPEVLVSNVKQIPAWATPGGGLHSRRVDAVREELAMWLAHETGGRIGLDQLGIMVSTITKDGRLDRLLELLGEIRRCENDPGEEQ